ncbi:glycosyltransferase family 1 protein [Microbacterium sp. AG157]|uniref:glycosyltransferase family 4 protein n=1 Tax=Microbacterium sp. AG157 TaxID=2183993 RepID=UPI0015F258B2|nr:glycosyltransferase family 1 protein [Microbacterium sp. AG157]
MREIIFGWSRRFPEDEIVLAVRARHRNLQDVPPDARIVFTRLSPQALSNVVELPLQARRNRVDLVVSHNYTSPFTRNAVFIHDLLFEESPHWFTRKERVYFWPMSRLATYASTVFTSSRTEAARIERLHPRLSPVRATSLAISPALAAATPRTPAMMPTGWEGYWLCVGRLNRRKNLDTALRGAVASGLLSPTHPMIIVGSAEYSGANTELPENIRALVDAGHVIFAGRVSDEELRWLYSNANCLIFMSRDEGYGLPPAEARFFGTPAIVSDIPVMRELVPDAHAFVDPDSPTALATALASMPQRRAAGPVDGLQDAESAWEDIASRIRSASIAPRE